MFFRRLAAIVSLVIALALCGCGKKAPIESPSATLSESGSAGTTTLNSALQASKPATDELKAEHGENKADHRKGRGRADRIAVLADTLGLSEEQVTALEALQEAYAADVKALVDSTRTSGDRTDFREKMQALKQDFEADFNAILTDEQKARLEEIKANAAAHRKGRGRADRIAVLADTLGLSEEQVTALEALQEAYAADVKALIDSTRTSGDRTDFREKMQALKQDFEADFNAILTDEQKARLEEIKAAARERAGERSRRGRRHARGGGKDE